MAERDPNLPQSADPELQADLVRLLQVQGPLGMLNVLDVVIPTVSMGQVVPLEVTIRQPSFRSTDVFSEGVILNAQVAGFLLADTGQLAAGVYDVIWFGLMSDPIGGQALVFEHRNAANNANLAVWNHMTTGFGAAAKKTHHWPGLEFSYEVGSNERLRITARAAQLNDNASSATIFARRRT